jgi:hypothetical protein
MVSTSIIERCNLPVKAVAVLTGRPDCFLAEKFSLSKIPREADLRSALAPPPAPLFAVSARRLDLNEDVVRCRWARRPHFVLVGSTVDTTILNFHSICKRKIGSTSCLAGTIRDASVGGVRDETIQKSRTDLDCSGQFIGGGFREGNPETRAGLEWTRVERELAPKTRAGDQELPKLVISVAAVSRR